MYSKILLVLFPAATLFATQALADGTILFCNTGGCTGSCSTQTVAGDGTCRQLGGIDSASAQSVDPNCAFTVYVDSSCSVDPTTVGLGSCIAQTENGLNSYSYDC